MGIIKHICLVALTLSLSLAAYCNTIILNDSKSSYTLESYLQIIPASKSINSIDNLLKHSNKVNFQALNDFPIGIAPEQAYWLKFNIENNLPDGESSPEWVLQFGLILTDIQVYAIDEQGNKAVQRSGFFMPIKDRTYLPTVKGNFSKLTLLPQKKYTVYIKAKCEREKIAPNFSIKISNLLSFQADLETKKRGNAFYLGFILMLFLYNIILFFFIKDRSYIYYSIYLGAIAQFTAYNSGDLSELLVPNLFPDTPTLIYYFKLPVYVGMAGYLYFLRNFLELEKILPLWDQFLKWIALFALPCLIMDTFFMVYTNFSYNISDMVLVSYAIIFVSTSFGLLPFIAKNGNRNGRSYFIIVGVLAMGIGTLSSVKARLQSIDFSMFYFKIGSIIEIIAFSLGLAYQQILNEKEKQKAKFALVKSKLIQEQEQREALRLKELNEFKSQLYTNITHEFRTPLTVIMGMNEEVKGNDKAKELIHRNSTNLLRLINQLLDLAKAEAGHLELQETNTEVIHYIKYLTESFLSAAEAKNVQLSFYTEIDSLLLSIDEQKLQHIVQNLLSNAIKFTNEFDSIIIHIKSIILNQKAYIRFIVKDTGIGIPPKDLPNIFDRFYQSSTHSSRKTQGTGIGLSLTKELIIIMGGDIQVTSQEGKGSEFIVTLPIKQPIAELEITEPTSYNINTNTTVPFTIGDTLVDHIPNKNPIILVIEDNIDVFIYIQHCLEYAYNVALAQNGTVGINVAKELIPDLIICDVMMPEKDGFEVVRTLKKEEKTSHIPIIFLTAKATQEDKLMGLAQGANAYLIKPFDKKELLIRIEQLLKSRNRLQEYYAKADFKTPSTFSDSSPSEIAFLEKLNDFIDDNLINGDHSMDNLAKNFLMSQVQIYRKIKSLTNKTPTQYMRTHRMKKAKELLQTTDLNITEIAYQLGYSDPNYFSRTFNKEFGQSPSSFRG